MNKHILPITAVLISLSVFIYAFASNSNTGSPDKHPVELTEVKGKEKEKALEQLKVQVMDVSYQIDGKVSIAYTNMSSKYTFELKNTGLKYEQGKKTKYLKRRTPVVVKPLETVELEISIPLFITPKVAYAFKDEVIIKKR